MYKNVLKGLILCFEAPIYYKDKQIVNNFAHFSSLSAGVPLFPMELSATTTPKQLATPFHPNPYVAMELEYTIKAPANNLITLEVTTVMSQ